MIPDAFLALDYMLDRFCWIVDGLVVYPERMRRNLEACTASSSRTGCCSRWSSLACGATRPTVSSSAHAMHAWEEERDFAELVRSDSDDLAAASTWTRSSTWIPPSVTWTPSSNGSATSNRRRRQFMSEATVHVGSGKVRELYELDDDRLLLVASDRISVFDVVLPTEIPDKGRVLTGLSGFWFARTQEIVPNHLLALREDGRSTECKRLEMLPIECVVRGYITGSGWKDYKATGQVCGVELPADLKESQQLPEPIFTPTTKAQTGHDEPLDREGAVALVGEERFERSKRRSLELYQFVSDYARERGIILADTKLEFGLDEDGTIVLATRSSPPTRLASGRRTASSRADHSRRSTSSTSATTRVARLGQDGPGPELPDKVVTGTRRRYLEAFERLTGIPFSSYPAEPRVVLK